MTPPAPEAIVENRTYVWCDTHCQVITGARAGGATTTECCAWNLRTRRHCKHTQCCYDTDSETTRVLLWTTCTQPHLVYMLCKHTWTVISVAGYDLSSQPLAVISLPLWTGIVTLSPPALNPTTTWLGTLCPVTPLTPATVTWKDHG